MQILKNHKTGQQARVENIEFSPELFKELQLHINNSRQKRRQIARQNKINWNTYIVLEREIFRRKQNNLNLLTGKEK